MGMFDGLTADLGALGAGVLGFAGTQSTNDRSIDVANANNAWSAQQYATRYQTTVKDLEAAGLNPMLAYSQGAGSAPTAQQVQLQNPVSSAVQAWQSARGTEAQATKDYSSAAHADSLVKQADAMTDKIKEETKNIPDQGKVLRQQAQMLSQQSTLMAQQGETEQQRQKVLAQTVKNLYLDGQILKADYDAMVKTNFVGRIAREVKPMSDIGSDWVDKLLPWTALKSKEREGALDRASRERSRSYKERGTSYDSEGNVTGGYSRERN